MNKVLLLLCCLTFSGCTTHKNILEQSTNVKEENQLCRLMDKKNTSSLRQEEFKKQKDNCNSQQKKTSLLKSSILNKNFTSTSNNISNYPEQVFKNIALETCKEAIRTTLYFPHSFKEEISKTTIKMVDRNAATLKIPFTAKTGMGEETKQFAYCVVNHSGKILILNILNR